jgi:type III secretory pathway component EscS
MKLLQEHLEHPKTATRADTCFLCSLFFLVVVLPIVLVAGIIGAIIVGIMAALGRLG